MTRNSIHEEQPVHIGGALLEIAAAAMIMVHGRGASAPDILAMATHFDQSNFAYLAPQAANHSWYPQRFIVPIEANEPYLTSALKTLDGLVKQVQSAGIPTKKIMLIGFSQGACLVLEYAARHAQRYGGVAALSGGLIGDVIDQDRYQPGFAGTPIFLGCSDVDFHIPLERVKESTTLLQGLGANVTERIYPGMGHMVNQDEVDFVREMMEKVL